MQTISAYCRRALLLGGLACAAAAPAAAQTVSIEKEEGKVVVKVDGKVFTRLIYGADQRSPVFDPLMGPGEVRMNRSWPMGAEVAGEEHDHPHHRTMWFGQDNVNGVKFWEAANGNIGKIEQTEIVEAKAEGNKATIKTNNKWVDQDGRPVMTDTRTINFEATPDQRVMTFEITLHASEGPVTFGDTKEGMLGIRTNEVMRLKPTRMGRGQTELPQWAAKDVQGQAVNSEGIKGLEGDDRATATSPIWGKKAKWIDYWAPIDGQTAGIAILDSPKNPNYPSHWMARDYGLISATPFASKAFTQTPAPNPAETPAYQLEAGKDLTLAWRVIFHKGDATQAKIAEQFETWAAERSK